MARAIKLKICQYEIDDIQANGTRTVVAKCLLNMDAFNVGTAATKINETKSTNTAIPFHTSIRKNEREFGIHPRYLVGELKLSAANTSACYGTQPKRIVLIPVLTLEQFDKFKVYDKNKGGTQASTTIKVNHSFDGKTGSDYTIIRKVDQVLI